jgi:hypothetical protein
MSKEIYIVAYGGWEEYGPVILEGPASLDFEEYCKPFLIQAAQAVINEAWQTYHEIGGCYPTAYDVRDNLVQLLLDTGKFQKLKPQQVYINNNNFSKHGGEELEEDLNKHIANQLHELYNLPDKEV